ncbi:TPM domain-containing protein [bacterium]|nr:TPM domain-containing protein [bacterium]
MWHADAVFGADDVVLDKFTDAAGVLRMKDREPLRRVLDRFERKFPQLFVSIYLGAFEDVESLQQCGFWMLNRAAYVDVDLDRPNENGILILVDVNAKSAAITYGYALLPYLDEDTTFAALSAGHPSFIQGDFAGALATVIKKLEACLIKGWKRVKKDPDSIFAEAGQNPKKFGELLQRIREGNQVTQAEEADQVEESEVEE